MGIEGYGAYGVVGVEGGLWGFVVAEDLAGEGVVGETGRLASLGQSETLALAVEDQFGVVNEGYAVGCGELLGTRADEVDVRAPLEDEAGGLNRVAETLDTGHAARLHAAAVHEKGVELDTAVGGEKAAAAGVEGGVVFKDGDCGLDGIEGRAAAGEDGIAGLEGVADSGLVSVGFFGRDGPGTAVSEEGGDVCGRDCHEDIVEHFRGERREDGILRLRDALREEVIRFFVRLASWPRFAGMAS